MLACGKNCVSCKLKMPSLSQNITSETTIVVCASFCNFHVLVTHIENLFAINGNMGDRMTVYSCYSLRISTGSHINKNRQSFSAENHLDLKVVEFILKNANWSNAWWQSPSHSLGHSWYNHVSTFLESYIHNTCSLAIAAVHNASHHLLQFKMKSWWAQNNFLLEGQNTN